MSTQLRSFCWILLLSLLVVGARLNAQRGSLNPEETRQLAHQDPQWPTVQAHLPDPVTASAEKLEMAGDVLRARRFPEDALDYYMYALQRGGKEVPLWNKMGVTELELRHPAKARGYFHLVVKAKKKSAEGWNNLGAVEYLDGHFGSAISNYKRAIKLDKKAATYHSNLATAYLSDKNFNNARKEFGIALALDPQMFERRGTAGVTAHLLPSDDRARFCFEMARVYAQRGDEANLFHYLTMSSEGGFDVLKEMGNDAVLERYRKDPRVLLLVRNARALRSTNASIDVPGGIPPLPPVQPE